MVWSGEGNGVGSGRWKQTSSLQQDAGRGQEIVAGRVWGALKRFWTLKVEMLNMLKCWTIDTWQMLKCWKLACWQSYRDWTTFQHVFNVYTFQHFNTSWVQYFSTFRFSPKVRIRSWRPVKVEHVEMLTCWKLKCWNMLKCWKCWNVEMLNCWNVETLNMLSCWNIEMLKSLHAVSYTHLTLPTIYSV